MWDRAVSTKLWGVALLAATAAFAQERRARIDVEHYKIDAEINHRTQTLAARAAVRFLPLEDNTTTVTFELNNALNVTKVTDDKGAQIPSSRYQQDFTIRLSFPQPLVKGQATTVIFDYDGRLSGQEESPVYGIRFASIQNESAYLLYPGRWFPVNGYSTDRFSAELNLTVPAGQKVLASGLESPAQQSGEKKTYSFRFDRPSFPGSLAVVKEGPGTVVKSEGVTTTFYFRGGSAPSPAPGGAQSLAFLYGQEAGKIMTHFTSLFGLPPYANLTVVETEANAPAGYSAPGVLFLSPRAIGREVNTRLLSNQIARQWWGTLASPVTRNHLWLNSGLAAYAEALYIEHVSGPAALENEMRDAAVEALTVDNVPQAQAARLEDYSPELAALTGAKGAATLHMLRFVVGDKVFFQALKDFAKQYTWKSASTDDFRKVVEAGAQQKLDYFFIQWVESSGAPEFKLEYTIFRTQKGFRAMGKVSQDLDTFRMPVDLKIETEGNPEEKRVEVVGTSSEFSVDTFGKPKAIQLDPNNRVLRYSNPMRLAVAIRRGEQFAEVSEFTDALKEFQKALEASRTSSLAHYRIAEVFFNQGNYQSAANEFRQTLDGDLQPKWTEVWAHINLGKIFDITSQRDRAVNEYKQAERTKDNTQGALEEAAKYLKQPYERQKKAEQ
ncbi:MAG: peptidase M1 [Candidatus Solibacter usitatus]|nr:peptidase M1 [Candidatus Solibacter usitatus]